MIKRKVVIVLLLLISFTQISALELCQNKTSADLLEIIKISDTTNTQNNWTWTTKENVKISVEAENKNISQNDFIIELFFYDEDEQLKNNFVQDGNSITKTINMSEGETTTTNFAFEVNNIPSGTYSLYVKITNENNETICTSLRAETENNKINISVKQENKLVVIRNITGPSTISPGVYAEYIVNIINIGDKIEERVLTVIYNSDLKLREEKETLNLGVGEKKSIKFNFTIPTNTTTISTTILFAMEFGYNNETGHYEESSIKNKIFALEITPLITNNTQEEQNQSVEMGQNQLEPETTQVNSNNSSSSPPYLWIISIAILIMAIITIVFFYIKKENTPSTTGNQPNSSQVNAYLKKINAQNPASQQPVNNPDPNSTSPQI